MPPTAAQVVEETLRWLEEQGAGAWLDQGTEHPHRLALSVRSDRLHDTYHRLTHAFSDRGLQVSCLRSSAPQQSATDLACGMPIPHQALVECTIRACKAASRRLSMLGVNISMKFHWVAGPHHH